MKHVILTRYNFGWHPDRHIPIKNVTTGDSVDPWIWLEARKSLFLNYYLPSMQAQTVRDYKLILSVSPDSPGGYFDFVNEQTELDIELHEGPFNRAFKETLFSGLEQERLLTTRVDNDDAVAPRFVEKIQSIANRHQEQKPLLIDVWGHKYFAAKKLFVVENYGMKHASQYCSVLSTKQQFLWAYETAHGSMPERIGNMVKIKESLYVTVVHEHNLGNYAFRGGDTKMDWFLRYCQ